MMVAIHNLRIMEVMADTTNVIAEGEVLQLLNCHDPETSETHYLEVIQSKTARLFEAAARVGAVLAQSGNPQEDAIARYGLHLGTAYQLVDDVLDYEGASETTGKNVGDDLAEGKPTLPLIYAMRVGNDSQTAAIRAAIESGGREHIQTVLAAVESTGAITYTARAAQTEIERALAALESIPDSPYREALRQLAEFCVSRSF